jgi:hypothetical protein
MPPRTMSALGQKRTYAVQQAMSAAPNSDRKSRHAAKGHVRFTPESGRVRRNYGCPLWAKSRHHFDPVYSISLSARRTKLAGNLWRLNAKFVRSDHSLRY